MIIQQATESDLSSIMPIYDAARQFMRSRGNSLQWINGYPSHELVLSDIKNGYCYVGIIDETIEFVFAFIIGEDPTYKIIDGQWLNNKPYGTIHRLASSGRISGVVKSSVEYCFNFIDNIRIDTHECNLPMQHAVERIGFCRCGIIHIADGSPRIAYQAIK